MNHYPHHIGDYDSDTAHLSWLEDMAYTRLIRRYYKAEVCIPASIKDACRLVRAKHLGERKAVESVLKEFFTLESDGWHSKRCDEEIGRYKAKAQAGRENGLLGGRPKQTETEPENNPKGLVNGTQDLTQQNHNHNHNQNHNQKESLGARPRRNKLGSDALIALGVDQQTAEDWITVRKEKHAPLTQTALDALQREAAKAGITVAQAVLICARKSWQGFNASWDWRDALPKKSAAELIDEASK